MANSIVVPYNFVPRDYQLEFLSQMDAGKKRGFLKLPRRAGKDKICWAYMCKEAVKSVGNYFYVFPVALEAKKALWENIDSAGFRSLDHLPKEVVDSVNNQEMLIRLKNGSTIRMLGSDANPDSIRGIAAKGVVFSEFAYQDPNFYKIVMPAVRESKGWAIFNSTPSGRNHFYKMELSIADKPNWAYVAKQTLWPHRDDYINIIDPKDLVEIMDEEGLTQEDMEREFGCSYATGIKGSFYIKQIEKAAAEQRVGMFPYDENLWVDTFWDLGVDDSTAIWFRQIDGGRIVWVDYYEDSGKDIAFYVKILHDKGYNYRTHYLPHDGANRTIQTQFKTDEIFRHCLDSAGLPSDVVVAPKLKVQDGINAVRARFSRYFFNSALVAEGLEKLSLYHRRYDKKREVFLKEPVHDSNSHAADAIRMEAIVEEYGEDPVGELYKPVVVDSYDVFEDD